MPEEAGPHTVSFHKARVEFVSIPPKKMNDPVTINGLVTRPPLIWSPAGQEPLPPSERVKKSSKGVTVRQALRQSDRPFSFQRFGAALVAMVAMLTLCAMPAVAASSKYAAIVMDARTGKVLHSENADARRYPASLTKMMTLYLPSRRCERQHHEVTPSASPPRPPPAANQARRQAGGYDPRGERRATRCVRARRTTRRGAWPKRSPAPKQNFAAHDDAKARALGMSTTLFRNPHGLPDPGQLTTRPRHGGASASRCASIIRNITATSPTDHSSMAGRASRNHNRLLGKIRGVDGIKTGYIRASGFNLVSSVRTAIAASSPLSWAARRQGPATPAWPS